MKPQIKFIIDKKGNVKVEDVCGAGMSCEQMTADIEKALGSVDEGSRAHTDNYVKPIIGDITLGME